MNRSIQNILRYCIPALCFCTSVAIAETRTWKVELTGTLGGSATFVGGLNNLGQIAGKSFTYDDLEALPFLWSRGKMTSLGQITGSQALYLDVTGLNDAGVITGSYAQTFGPQRPYTFKSGVFTDLGSSGYAYDINNLGQVVGDNFRGQTIGFLYNGGEMKPVAGLSLEGSVARGLNDLGNVVGAAQNSSGQTRGYINVNGTVTEVGSLGTYSWASTVNNSREIAGFYNTSAGTVRGFVFKDGVTTDLGRLGNGPQTFAVDINESGSIVGFSSGKAFLFTRSGMEEVSVPGLRILESDLYINDFGQIAGTARLQNGELSGFLLSPIPEPATIVYCILGLVGVLTSIRRRRISTAN